eukprot:scaffold396_cov339-Prasinococcus_capsulatus_cf.AAC.22
MPSTSASGASAGSAPSRETQAAARRSPARRRGMRKGPRLAHWQELCGPAAPSRAALVFIIAPLL